MDAETSSYETFTETVMPAGQMLYSTPNVSQAYWTVPLYVSTPLWRRGPGFYTSQTQVAADALALTMRTVTFRLGDSLLPPTPPHGGSAVLDGCDKVRRQAVKLTVEDRESPLYGGSLLSRNKRAHLEALGSYAGASKPERRSFYAYNATFAEAVVDATLGLVRVRRMLGVYDAGRIGTALLEHTVTDHRDGRIVNANLADYLGLGEVVRVGVAPAIGNAVFNATGRRIRQLPSPRKR